MLAAGTSWLQAEKRGLQKEVETGGKGSPDLGSRLEGHNERGWALGSLGEERSFRIHSTQSLWEPEHPGFCNMFWEGKPHRCGR